MTTTALPTLTSDGASASYFGSIAVGSSARGGSRQPTVLIGEDPDWFYADVRGAPWDGSRGMRLTAPWDGHGMTATQSHGFEFRDFPVSRVAWARELARNR